MITANTHAVRFFSKKSKKEKAKETKVIPVQPSIEEYRAVIERRFEKIERERFGPHRGRQATKEILKEEKIHKKVTTKMADHNLNEWVYTRHALRFGFRHILDMNKVALGQTIIREGSSVKLTMIEAKIILKECFRYGKSGMLDKFLIEDDEFQESCKKIAAKKEENLAKRREMQEAGYTAEQIQIFEDNRRKRRSERLPLPEILQKIELWTAVPVPSSSQEETSHALTTLRESKD